MNDDTEETWDYSFLGGEKSEKAWSVGNTVDMSHISYLKIEIQCNENRWVCIGELTSRAKWLSN